MQLQYIVEELRLKTPSKLEIHVDADAAIGYAKNNGGGTRMKHIAIREA